MAFKMKSSKSRTDWKLDHYLKAHIIEGKNEIWKKDTGKLYELF